MAQKLNIKSNSNDIHEENMISSKETVQNESILDKNVVEFNLESQTNNSNIFINESIPNPEQKNTDQATLNQINNLILSSNCDDPNIEALLKTETNKEKRKKSPNIRYKDKNSKKDDSSKNTNAIKTIIETLDTKEELIALFNKYDLEQEDIPIFYIFTLHFLLKGHIVFLTAYKMSEKVKLAELVALERARTFECSTVSVVIAVKNVNKLEKQLSNLLLTNPNKFILSDSAKLSDIPEDKSIVIASFERTYTVLQKFQSLFKGAKRMLILVDVCFDHFRLLSSVIPVDCPLLVMHSFLIEKVINNFVRPCISIGKAKARLSIAAMHNAVIDDTVLSAIQLFHRKLVLHNNNNEKIGDDDYNEDFDNSFKNNINLESSTYISTLPIEYSKAPPLITKLTYNQTRSLISMHGHNPSCIPTFYIELLSYFMQGDNIICDRLQNDNDIIIPLLDVISLHKSSNNIPISCHTLICLPQAIMSHCNLINYPSVYKLVNTDDVTNHHSILLIDSICIIKKLINLYYDVIKNVKLIIFVDIPLNECCEVIPQLTTSQIIVFPCKQSDVNTIHASFAKFQKTFVLFSFSETCINIDTIGASNEQMLSNLNDSNYTPNEDSHSSKDDIHQPTNNAKSTNNENNDTTSYLIQSIMQKNNLHDSIYSALFSTFFSHLFQDHNLLVEHDDLFMLTELVTALYKDYAQLFPGGGYVIFCMGSLTSCILSGDFRCPSNLWLDDNVAMTNLPVTKTQNNTLFLTSNKMLNILKYELDFLVKISWLVVFIGLSHQEITHCVPNIPLTNQYVYILNVAHPQFKKYMSVPYFRLYKSKRNKIVVEPIHIGKLKSFVAEYKTKKSDQILSNNSTKKPADNKSRDLITTETQNICRFDFNIFQSILQTCNNIIVQVSNNSNIANANSKTLLAIKHALSRIDFTRQSTLQVIISTPTNKTSANVLMQLSQFAKSRNLTHFNPFMYITGDFQDLQQYIYQNSIHLLVTLNSQILQVQESTNIMKNVNLIIFDELCDSSYNDDVTNIVPHIFRNYHPRDVQFIIIITTNEDENRLMEITPRPLYHIKQNSNIDNSANISKIISCEINYLF